MAGHGSWVCPWQENRHKPQAEPASSTVAAFPFIPGCSGSPSFLIWGVGGELQSFQSESHSAALLLPVSVGPCIKKGGAAGGGAGF